MSSATIVRKSKFAIAIGIVLIVAAFRPLMATAQTPVKAIPVAATAPAPATAPSPTFNCTASDVQERLPTVVRFQITNRSEIEAKAFDKAGRETSATLRRSEAPVQTREAVFMMGGQLGVSGDVRMLIARSALEFGEVGTIMIVNQSTRDSLAYQCSRASL